MRSSTRPVLFPIFGLACSLGLLAAPAAAEPRTATYKVQSRLSVTVPEDALRIAIWMPMPQKDEASHLEDIATAVELGGAAGAPAAKPEKNEPAGGEKAAADAPAKEADKADASAATGAALTMHRDSHGNEIGYLEIKRPHPGEIVINQTFTLTRSEILGQIDAEKTRPLSDEEKTEHQAALEASTYIPLSADIKKLAAEIAGNEKNPAKVARKIYDWELDNVDYWAKDPERYQPSPMGSAVYCLSTRSGNCADFHSLYVALARANGIPARMVYGSLLKKQMDGSREDAGTHCWVEIFLPELGWKTVDVSLADLYHGELQKTAKNEKLLLAATPTGELGQNEQTVDYYFGNADERRVVWSRGRDITLAPRQAGIPLNSLPKAYVEVDGREHSGWQRVTTFTESKN